MRRWPGEGQSAGSAASRPGFLGLASHAEIKAGEGPKCVLYLAIWGDDHDSIMGRRGDIPIDSSSSHQPLFSKKQQAYHGRSVPLRDGIARRRGRGVLLGLAIGRVF